MYISIDRNVRTIHIPRTYVVIIYNIIIIIIIINDSVNHDVVILSKYQVVRTPQRSFPYDRYIHRFLLLDA